MKVAEFDAAVSGADAADSHRTTPQFGRSQMDRHAPLDHPSHDVDVVVAAFLRRDLRIVRNYVLLFLFGLFWSSFLAV